MDFAYPFQYLSTIWTRISRLDTCMIPYAHTHTHQKSVYSHMILDWTHLHNTSISAIPQLYHTWHLWLWIVLLRFDLYLDTRHMSKILKDPNLDMANICWNMWVTITVALRCMVCLHSNHGPKCGPQMCRAAFDSWSCNGLRGNCSQGWMFWWFWVNYDDLTTTSLGIMVHTGNHPQMALIQVSELL